MLRPSDRILAFYYAMNEKNETNETTKIINSNIILT